MKNIPSFAKFSNVPRINSSKSMAIFYQYHNFDRNLAKTCDNFDFIYPESAVIMHVHCKTCAKVTTRTENWSSMSKATIRTSIPI